MPGPRGTPRFDVVVVGAGFAGLHMLWVLRRSGRSVLVVERGQDVGGTWYWNRYPGCRCDVQSLDYSIPWDPQLDQEWDWSERYSTQPEILRYVRHVADRHDLRRDIRFGATVERAAWDDTRRLWMVDIRDGGQVEASVLVSAAGALSEPNLPDIPGIDAFAGEIHHTGRWPTEPVEFAGKRVAVLGTGSTGIQASTAIAGQAEHLYVLQRTAQYSLPCHTPSLTDAVRAERKARYPQHRDWQRGSYSACWLDLPLPFGAAAFDDPRETRLANYETCWRTGTNALMSVYGDVATDAAVNAEVSDFVRDKIREIVRDPLVAEALCPAPDARIGSRRIILDTGYYDIFNRADVSLVDIRQDPIVEIAPAGVRTRRAFYPLDVLVVATGYDAVTGPLLAMNISGRGGITLKDAWRDGPRTYLGLATAGFPNLFMITGPGSPGVLANVIFSIDQHVNWISACLDHMAATGTSEIEATAAAQEEWREHALQTSAKSLRVNDDNNWYLGTNVPGKPRAVLVYQGGLGYYRSRCDEVAGQGYRGFELRPPPVEALVQRGVS